MKTKKPLASKKSNKQPGSLAPLMGRVTERVAANVFLSVMEKLIRYLHDN